MVSKIEAEFEFRCEIFFEFFELIKFRSKPKRKRPKAIYGWRKGQESPGTSLQVPTPNQPAPTQPAPAPVSSRSSKKIALAREAAASCQPGPSSG